MKILWVCNIMLPYLAGLLDRPHSVREGWLSGTFERLLAEPEYAQGRLELGICFPAQGELAGYRGRVPAGGRTVACYGFPEDLSRPEVYDPGLVWTFKQILADFQPELLHVFGTEFPHALACVKAFGQPERTLVGIQGVCSAIAECYMADLPEYVQKSVTFRDMVKKDSLRRQQEKFVLRGEREKEVLRLTGHVAGRTAFDRRTAFRMNPNVNYHRLEETMRASFYSGGWEACRCERHRIFFSQADYPLKGFHYLLEAMPRILERFPDTMVAVAGNSIISRESVKDKIKAPAYGAYLRHLIHKYSLNGHIKVLGSLEEEQMKEQYLQCHVFICASSLENSPNSLGEAMLLGVPSVASAVGGVPDLMKDGVEGLLFARGDTAGLADAVIRLFEDDSLAARLAAAARNRALKTHNREENSRRLVEIYQEIAGE